MLNKLIDVLSRRLLLFSISATLLFGLLTAYFINSSVLELIVAQDKYAASKLAKHTLSELPFLNTVSNEPISDDILIRSIEQHIEDLGLFRLKVFSRDGITIYSSEPNELGKPNRHDYFLNKVMKGEIFQKLIRRDGQSASGSVIPLDVIETYIPIMDGGDFRGAFEIYSNFTDSMNLLRKLLYKVTANSVILGTILIGAIVYINRRSVHLENALTVNRLLLERKMADEGRRKSEESLQIILNTVPALIYLKNHRGEYQFVNRTWQDALALRSDDIIGRTPHDIFPQAIAELLTKEDGDVLASRDAVEVVRAVPFKDGPRTLLSREIALRDGTDVVYAVCGIATDVTDLVETRKRLEVSEEKFHSLFQALSEGVALHEVSYEGDVPVDYRLLDVNPAYERILGIRRQDAIGSRGSELYGEFPAPYLATFAGVADSSEPVQFETYFAHMGKHFSISVVSPRPGQFVTVFEDITARKRAQTEIIRNEQRFRAIFENAAVGIALVDSTGRYTDANNRFLEMLGYSRGELLGLSFRDITHPEDLEGSETKLSQSRIGQTDRSFEYVKRYLHKDGSPIWALLYATLVRDQESGEETGFALVVDIDARMKAEQELAASKERYRVLFESASDAILVFKGGVVVDVNRAGLIAFNCERGDLIGRMPLDLAPPVQPRGGDSRILSCLIAAQVDRGEPALFEWAHRRFDGSDFMSEVSLTPVDLFGEKLVLAHIRDITERKRGEERYRILFESAKDAIFVVKDGRFIDVNPAATDMFGLPRDEMLGLSPADISPPRQPDGRDSAQTIQEMKHRVEQGESFVFEWQHRRRDGSEFPAEILPTRMDLFGEKLFLIFSRDITERRRMQALMVQSEKMLSLGGLAAGLAHEINNPLGIVHQGAQSILRRIDPAIPDNAAAAARLGLDLAAAQAYFAERNILRYLQGIRDAGERVTAIVHNMLSFSRRSDSVKSMCDLGQIIDHALDIAASDYDLKKKYAISKIRITRVYDPALPQMPCSATEIEQVLLNLVRNAAQAMSSAATPEPRLSLRTIHETGWARIELEDNGPGVPHDKLSRIFEPFYTTKRIGEGTGLGLSVSYYIVTTNHHGQIFAESEPGKGTRFVIRLPLATDNQDLDSLGTAS